LKALNVHVLPPVCVVSISLTDSLRKQYCFICKDDSGRVKIKLSRLILTEQELREINSWVNKLDGEKVISKYRFDLKAFEGDLDSVFNRVEGKRQP
jgi:uncharacterized protein YbcI